MPTDDHPEASDDDGGYALHLALRRRFGEAGPQPFRLFADGPAEPHLLGYAADADALGDAAALPTVDELLDAELPARVALVLGNDTDGLSASVRPHLDGVLAIPMHNGVESLGVASAGAVAAFELARRRPAS